MHQPKSYLLYASQCRVSKENHFDLETSCPVLDGGRPRQTGRAMSSQIINFNSDNKLFDQVLNVYQHKGNMILTKEMLIAQDGLVSEKAIKQLSNKNVSDIAFIQKKL